MMVSNNNVLDDTKIDRRAVTRIYPKTNENNGLSLQNGGVQIHPKQMVLDGIIEVDAYQEINGIEMGVLEDGTPFLGQKGLAAFCDLTNNGAISILSKEWEEERDNTIKERLIYIRDYLYEKGFKEPKLYIEVEKADKILYAYPDVVCMAILEYYAFETKEPKPRAQNNFRLLARNSFREFIYKAVGYDPEVKELNRWKYFLDRIDINYDRPPSGYFSIFQELVSFTHQLIKNGFIANDKNIPDISVGVSWANYWKDNKLDNKHKDRVKYEHNYPSYFAQALSNPQEAWAYPNSVIAEFRVWLENEYFSKKFPVYLKNKVKSNQLSATKRDNLLKIVDNMKITMGETIKAIV